MKFNFTWLRWHYFRQLTCLIIIINLSIASSEGQGLPIKPTRTISLETTEGSYMDVDLSPDGKTIVFNLLGDIYTLPISGGYATQLTRGLAMNRYPIWSPSGSLIAYLSDVSGANHINVMNANGTSQRTLGASNPDIEYTEARYDGMPAWTPDGNYIAEHSYLHHIAGGCMDLPPQIKNVFDFSLDGRLIYYYSDKDTVRTYDRYSGTISTLVKLPKNSGNVNISPDGKWLTYITGGAAESDLIIYDLISGTERTLVSRIETHYRRFQEHYAFTIDSKNILIAFNGKINKINIESAARQIIPFTAKVNVEMGTFNYNTYKLTLDSLKVRYIRSANKSPDGKSLVFSALNRLYVIGLPNGEPHPLVEQASGQFQPMYSPDGKWIAYVTSDDVEGGALWRIPSTGGQPEKLTRDKIPSLFTSPTWSPDGEKIAVLKHKIPLDGSVAAISPFAIGELHLVSVKEFTSKKIADSIRIMNNLTFSQDGRRLTFEYRKSNQSPGLVSIDMDGRNPYILTIPSNKNDQFFHSEELTHQTVICSPDGRYLVFDMNEKLCLSPLPGIAHPYALNSRMGILPIIQFSEAGIDVHFENEGKMLCWSYGNKYYRVAPARIIDLALNAANDNTYPSMNNGIFNVDVKPDETIVVNISVPKHYGRGVIALKDVRIISMKGDEIIEHGTIVISNGIFTTVGPMEGVQIPINAKVFNLKGKTVIPGLIDLHDHIDGGNDILQQQPWDQLINLAYGVTSARNPSSTTSSFGVAELLQAGQMVGPRLFTVGVAVHHALENYNDAHAIVQQRARYGAICIKQYLQPTRLQKQWLLIASQEAGLNMTNEGDYDPQIQLAAIKDGSTGIEHYPLWGNVYSDVTQFVAASGTWHTPTLQLWRKTAMAQAYFHFSDKYALDNNFFKLNHFSPVDSFYSKKLVLKTETGADANHPNFIYVSSIEAKIRKQGGHVTMGGHGNDPGIGSHFETWALQMGGLTNLEALQSATINGAEAIGVQQDLGSIEVGKIADLIVLDKNPLDDIHNTTSIRYVMKEGELFDGNTLDSIWPIKKKLPEWRYRPMKDSSTGKLSLNNK